MKKCILLISAVFPPEPVVSAMLSYDIAMKLCSIGCKVVVVSPKPTRPLNYVFPKGHPKYPFEHYVLNSYTCPESRIIGRTRESISFGKAITKFISEYPEKIECIYANTWALFSQLALAQIAKKKRIPYIIHVQDVYPESYCFKLPKIAGYILYRLLIPIDKYVHKNAVRIIGISPTMIDYLSITRKTDRCKYVLARNWQNDQTFINAYKPIEEKAKRDFHLMYLGSINPTANVALVLKSLGKIQDANIHLSIVGNGPEKDNCQVLAKELGLDVSFDVVTPERVAEKQSEADVLMLCLKNGVAKTATPSKLTAYMLTGRPIIASVDLDSDCAQIIYEANCGLVVPPDDIVSLSKAISEMSLKTRDQLNNLGAAAFEYAKKHLSKDVNLNIVTKTICEIKYNQNE